MVAVVVDVELSVVLVLVSVVVSMESREALLDHLVRLRDLDATQRGWADGKSICLSNRLIYLVDSTHLLD